MSETERTGTYMVWAKDRTQAIDKASMLAAWTGVLVDQAEAERFPEGAQYGVNWKVQVSGTKREQCAGYAGDPGASAPRCELPQGHEGHHTIRPPR